MDDYDEIWRKLRLIYQKYKSCERELQDKGILQVEYDQRIDENATTSLLVRLEEWLGIGGYLVIFILLAAIFNALDIIVFYYFCYYGGLICCNDSEIL